ncbi:MAG: response regulator transcription factor [Ectothiorhodospiraceae bacterium]|nr:response regulator transcription factor [Chromatiales bacterium]MCP5156043.1 response regulator transcription factor [Ectothiorhodospiraceae bacterium]
MQGAATILLVEDDERLRRTLARFLAREGYLVREAGSGTEMRSRLRAERADLVILDLLLPGEDGFTLARELRATTDLGIIILTGKGETVDKVVGLELGADDYVTKPYDERELLARVRTVLRRTRKDESASPSIRARIARFEGWCLDIEAYQLLSPGGLSVHLTSNEFQLLTALVTRPNRVLSRGEILDLVAGRDWTPMDRSIDVLVGKLRKKIEPDPRNPTLVRTVRGAGYKFTGRVDFE